MAKVLGIYADIKAYDSNSASDISAVKLEVLQKCSNYLKIDGVKTLIRLFGAGVVLSVVDESLKVFAVGLGSALSAAISMYVTKKMLHQVLDDFMLLANMNLADLN